MGMAMGSVLCNCCLFFRLRTCSPLGVHLGLVHLFTSSVSCLHAGDMWHLRFDTDGYASIHCDGLSQCCTEIFDKSLHADSGGKLYINSEANGSSWVENTEAARAPNKGLHL